MENIQEAKKKDALAISKDGAARVISSPTHSITKLKNI
jgi:hypothetical protein